MTVLTSYPNGTLPTSCVNTAAHSPRPQRFVVHFVMPFECGGTSDRANTVEMCDNCHQAAGIGLWTLQTEGQAALNALHLPGAVKDVVQQGHAKAVVAAAETKIPKEATS